MRNAVSDPFRKAVSPFKFAEALITTGMLYYWQVGYGGIRIDQAHLLRELEQEKSRLKRLVADLSLDNAILKEAARGNS